MESKAIALPKEERPEYSGKGAAKYLGVQPMTLAKWRYRRRGPAYYKQHGKIMYSEADLIAFIKASRVDPKDRKPKPRRKRARG
jgi:hypothetical protein